MSKLIHNNPIKIQKLAIFLTILPHHTESHNNKYFTQKLLNHTLTQLPFSTYLNQFHNKLIPNFHSYMKNGAYYLML